MSCVTQPGPAGRQRAEGGAPSRSASRRAAGRARGLACYLLSCLVLAACASTSVSTGQRATARPPTGAAATRPAAAAAPALPGSAGTDSTTRETASTTREAAVQRLLDRRAAAVLGHDRVQFAATLDDVRTPFGLRQLAAFDNLLRLPLGTFRYGTVQHAPALPPGRAARAGPAAWVAKVQGEYSLAGYDRAPTSYECSFTVVRRGGGWKLAADTDGLTQAEPWDLRSLRVVRGASTLVVGNAPEATLAAYQRLGEAAVTQVAAVWHQAWPGRLVLVAPRTAAEVSDQLHQQVDVGQVAAVTDGPVLRGQVATADRVVINPDAFARLQPRGQAVVVTHETVHVAVRASNPGSVPLWLSEGLADYVGYRGLGLSPEQVAAALLRQVRADRGPRSLPVDGDFDPRRATIAPTYNAAWLAVRRIADEHGEAALTPFYVAASTTGTETAFHSVLGTSEAAFTSGWLHELRTLAAHVR